MEYRIIRSRRKTLAIYITKDARVEVRAPIQLSEKNIDKFVNEKQAWIEKHLEIMTGRSQDRRSFFIDYGSEINLCGGTFSIEKREGNKVGFDGERFFLPQGLSSEQIKLHITNIYKKLGKNILKDKVERYSEIMGVVSGNITITSAKTRWGSCSGNNNISFSWKLLFADEEDIDYVVVHELAHTKEHNHSERFWAIVAEFFPDYKERRKNLKELAKKLAAENWD